MSTIVLVPGGGLGGWAWSRVTPLLRDAGHDPHPITLTGTGDRAHLNRPGIDLSAWIADVIAHLDADELTDVILVGHSFAGTVISGVAARAPERLAHLVYLDALVPADDQSVFAAMGPEQAGFLEQLAAAHDGWSLPWFTDEQLDQFYGAHGLTSEDLAWMRRHLTAQPLATYREALHLSNHDVPRTYIACQRNSMPPAVDEDTPGWNQTTLDAGHWPLITAPSETAKLIDEIARKC
jgi:pimeloyl-ACP methyl ester carboxylesterase